jgi:hypothetical protein
MVSLIDMPLGMILGMALSPLIMIFIKDFRQRMKVNKILKEYVKNNKKDSNKNNSEF